MTAWLNKIRDKMIERGIDKLTCSVHPDHEGSTIVLSMDLKPKMRKVGFCCQKFSRKIPKIEKTEGF